MWRSHLRLALRSLRRDRGYALLGGISLAAALACCLLVGMFVRAERQVDAFHPNSDRLRAVWADMNWFAEAEPGLGTPIPLAAALEEHAAVERAAVTGGGGVQGVRVPGRDGLFTADIRVVSDGYLDLFGFRLLHGDRDRVLREPGVVLTEKTARRLFGNPAPIGRTLTLERWQDTLTVAVTGVLADSSGRSAIDAGADGLLPLAMLSADDQGNWRGTGPGTFLRLAPSATDADLAPVFERIARTHYADADTPPEFGVVPVTDLHLDAISPSQGFRGDAGFLRLFVAIALFVLALGVINYVNLATARATRRAREVGVRKSLGAGRGAVAAQFLAEAVVLGTIAGLAALALAFALRPGFNALFGSDLGAGDLDAPFVLAALGLSLATGLVAGFYPAAVLSGFRPAAALRGSAGASSSGGRLRQALVVVQLVVVVGLLSGTGVVLHQLAYAQSEDPGYDADGLVAVDLGKARLGAQWEAALGAVRALPAVEDAAATNGYPSNARIFYGDEVDGRTVALQTIEAEPDYLRVLGARVVAGRSLDDRESDRTAAVVLNQAAVEELGWGPPAEAVGRRFAFNGPERTLVGVVEDQHVDSFREPIAPMQLIVRQGWEGAPPTYGSLLVRLRPGRYAEGVADIRGAITGLGTEAAPEVTFLDDAMAELYEAERRLAGVLGAFAAVAVLLACLGLFGLAAYTAQRRTKEIGVRRVLGATVGEVVALLTREYVTLVALASIVAVPLTVLFLRRWLEGFAYHVALAPWVFAGAIALALVFALVAVGGQAIRAASAPPTRALRSE